MITKLNLNGRSIYENTAIAKVNEIIDLLNAIVVDVDGIKCVDGSKAPTDPYAEQRKWIGKLCRFRDNPVCEWKYGILDRIYEDTAYPFLDTDGYEYEECEPVKPDDDIIYKGGDNEE